jgi:hypothetical protein
MSCAVEGIALPRHLVRLDPIFRLTAALPKAAGAVNLLQYHEGPP